MVPLPRASLYSTTDAGGTVVVRLGGAVCLTSVAEISTGILDAVGGIGTSVTVDLGAVTFIDPRVMPAFLLALRQAEERGHVVSVIRPNRHVWRAVELSGLAGMFPACRDQIELREPGSGPRAAPETPTAVSLTLRERQVLFERSWENDRRCRNGDRA